MGYQNFAEDLRQSKSPQNVAQDKRAIGLLLGIPPTVVAAASREDDIQLDIDYYATIANASSGAVLRLDGIPIAGLNAKHRYNQPPPMRPMSAFWTRGAEIAVERRAVGKTGLYYRPDMPPGHTVYLIEGVPYVFAVPNSAMWLARVHGYFDNGGFQESHKPTRGYDGNLYPGDSLWVPISDLEAMGVPVYQVRLTSFSES